MNRLDKLIELGLDEKIFENLEEFKKAIKDIWNDKEIEIGYILSLDGVFAGLNISVEEGEYIARVKYVEDGKVIFIALEEVE